jgi:hypothetical protein
VLSTVHASIRDMRLPHRVTMVEVGPRDGLQMKSRRYDGDGGRFDRQADRRRLTGDRGDKLCFAEVDALNGGRCRTDGENPPQAGRALSDADIERETGVDMTSSLRIAGHCICNFPGRRPASRSARPLDAEEPLVTASPL